MVLASIVPEAFASAAIVLATPAAGWVLLAAGSATAWVLLKRLGAERRRIADERASLMAYVERTAAERDALARAEGVHAETVDELVARERIQTRILAEAVRLSAIRRLPEMLQRIVNAVGEIFAFERTVLYLWSDAAEVYEPRAHAGSGSDPLRDHAVTAAEFAALRGDAEAADCLLVVDGLAAPCPDDALPDWEPGVRMMGLLRSPGGDVLGYVEASEPGADSVLVPGAPRLLASLLQQAAAAVEAAEVYERLARNNAELSLASEQLASLADMKANFVANVSHELRTPLTSISAYTELLQENLTSLPRESLDEFLKVIHTESAKLTSVINDIIELSQTGGTRPSSRRTRTDLAGLTRRLEDGWRSRAADKRLHLDVSVPTTPIGLEADPVLLQQMMSHLVSNACKFTPAGGRVSVTLAETGTAVRLTVTDTGIGIPEQELGAIFEKFYQVDATATREHNGQGVGLAICHDIVSHHDGRIWAENTGSGGARFQVLLPRRPAVVQLSHDVPTARSPFEPGEFQQRLLHWLSATLGVQTVTLMQPDASGDFLRIQAAIGIPEAVVQGVRIRPESGFAGRVWTSGESLLIEDVTRDDRARRDVSEPHYSTPSLLCVPLRDGTDVRGVLSVNNRVDGMPLDEDDRLFLEALAPRVTDLLRRHEEWLVGTRRLQDLRVALRATTAVGHLRQESLLGICQEICLATARQLNLPPDELSHLAFALQFADVGMGCVPPQLLEKPEPLSRQERELLRRHVEVGLEIIEPLQASTRARQIILHHHENYDGTGYPGGLAGESIPLGARLVRLSDTLAALLSPRAWRDACDLDGALAEIRAGSGQAYCPRLTDVFLAEAEARRERLTARQHRDLEARDLARPALDRRGMVVAV